MASGDAGSLKWENMFEKDDDQGSVDIPDLDDEDYGAPKAKKKAGGNKRLSVERIYQKKTQLEHILLRPDTYIGSIEKVTQQMWCVNEDGTAMEQREMSYVPGLYKIFDEIMVNAADNKQRDAKMNTLKIDIDPENCKIKIWNNGKGIPVVMHQTEKMYVPSLIFGILLTSSNYNDEEKKVTGGRNGFGAKLCNVFSTKFVLETQCNEYKKAFRQTWTNNMSKASEPKITEARGEDYTCVTFYPDLTKFRMESLDKDIVDIFTRRAYDIAACAKGVKVMLNGKRLPVNGFKQYCNMHLKGCGSEEEIKLVYENAGERWEIGAALSEKGFQQASFVNSIATIKGGRHVDYVTDMVVAKVIEAVKKKEKKGAQIKPFQVKNHLWIFVNCLIENPTFDSQTKENMTSLAKNFGSKITLSEKFIKEATSKAGIVDAVQSWMRFKANAMLDKKSGSKTSKLKGIPKLDDANNAGTKHSLDCTLILTEGDSAKTLAVAGLSIVGRDNYGVFPLKGKVLNVREASQAMVRDNAEICSLLKIIGLKFTEKYETPESLKALRYGKIMIMTDQDQDGSHIKGLLINFIHSKWPALLKHGFLNEFITPIVKVKKGNFEKSFYSMPEFEEWKAETDNWHTYRTKYYKGLGTSTSKEAKEYFSDMQRHKVDFEYKGAEDDSSIILAFSKKKVDDRKEWLTNWMEERKRRTQLGLPELYLYGKDTKTVSYTEFVNRELILFSNADNERSIPSLMDGLKPGQRKVLFTCFKRKLFKELKVAQLAGSVAEISAYHHGETSLMSTIIGLAQNFVGSNNINLLVPQGQFGTRLTGGKDAASPRYIFTNLSPLSRLIFNPKDDMLLKNLYDDNVMIEPEWYCPIIPMVLVNGADGIGTGWSTKIPNYDPREIVRNIKRLLEGRQPEPMMPWFKNFRGTIEQLDNTRFAVNGEAGITETDGIEITELPIRTWTTPYKDMLENMMKNEKTPAIIIDFREYHTDTTVKFNIRLSAEKLAWAEHQGIHKTFKLQTVINQSSMVLFDNMGVIRRYDNVMDILREFYTVRLDYYQKRKDALEAMLAAESLKLDNIARFIVEKIDGILTIENKPKKELIQMLVRRGYDSDPVKAWKEANAKLHKTEAPADEASQEEEAEDKGPDFNYLLGMPLWNLTKEKKDALLKDRDEKAEELYQLRKKSKEDLYLDDLDEFLVKLDEIEEQERKDSKLEITTSGKTAKGRKTTKKIKVEETMPSPMCRRIEPTIDASLRAKVEAANKALKRKVEKKEKADMFGPLDDDDEDSKMGLAERLAAAQGMDRNDPALTALSPTEKAAAKPKAKRAPRVKKEKSEKASPKKKGTPKKKNPWSDSESDMSKSDISDDDMESNFVVEPRDRAAPRRTAAAKKKYNYDDESDDAPKFSDDDDDDDEAPPPKKFTNGSSSKVSDDVTPSQSPPPSASPPRLSPPRNYSDDSDDGGVTQSTRDDIFSTQSSNRPKSPIFSVDDSDDEPSWPPKESKPDPPKKEAKKEPAKPKKEPAPKKKTAKPDPKQPTLFQMQKSKPKPKPKFSDSEDENLIIDTESDGGDTAFVPPTKSKETKPSKSKASRVVDTDSDSDGGDNAFVPSTERTESKPTKSKASTAPKKAPVKRKPKFSDLSDLSDDDAMPKAAKKPAPKKRAPAKPKAEPKKKPSKGSSDEDDWGASPPKKKSTTSKKKKTFDSDDDDMDIGEVAPRAPAAGGRSRKTVKYNFDQDSDDDDFY